MVTRKARDLSIHAFFSCFFIPFQDKEDKWVPESGPAVAQASLERPPGPGLALRSTSSACIGSNG